MKKIIYGVLFLWMAQGQAQNIVKMEYFVESDPGMGLATDISGFVMSPDVVNQIFSVPVGTSLGVHTCGIRSKDANGTWSLTNFYSLYVFDSSHAVITQLEYFWDADPGINNGMDTVLSAPVADFANGILYASVPLSLDTGLHTLFARSKENRNRWSHTNYCTSINVIPMAIGELSKPFAVSIYPNPAIDKVYVEAENNQPFRFILHSANGQVLLDKMLRGKAELNLSPYSSGIYIAFAWMEKDRIYKTTILKQ